MITTEILKSKEKEINITRILDNASGYLTIEYEIIIYNPKEIK